MALDWLKGLLGKPKYITGRQLYYHLRKNIRIDADGMTIQAETDRPENIWVTYKGKNIPVTFSYIQKTKYPLEQQLPQILQIPGAKEAWQKITAIVQDTWNLYMTEAATYSTKGQPLYEFKQLADKGVIGIGLAMEGRKEYTSADGKITTTFENINIRGGGIQPQINMMIKSPGKPGDIIAVYLNPIEQQAQKRIAEMPEYIAKEAEREVRDYTITNKKELWEEAIKQVQKESRNILKPITEAQIRNRMGKIIQENWDEWKKQTTEIVKNQIRKKFREQNEKTYEWYETANKASMEHLSDALSIHNAYNALNNILSQMGTMQAYQAVIRPGVKVTTATLPQQVITYVRRLGW